MKMMKLSYIRWILLHLDVYSWFATSSMNLIIFAVGIISLCGFVLFQLVKLICSGRPVSRPLSQRNQNEIPEWRRFYLNITTQEIRARVLIDKVLFFDQVALKESSMRVLMESTAIL